MLILVVGGSVVGGSLTGYDMPQLLQSWSFPSMARHLVNRHSCTT